ncbi:MAG: AraC family transcriptional regulator [Bacteroidota bacterium]|nr:AraC family transcriptional regulator [Bacteroidota bacterium]
MYSLTTKHCHPATFISKVGNSRRTKTLGSANSFLLPGVYRGFARSFKFQSGIECLVSDFNLKDDFNLHKIPLLRQFFILRIDEVYNASQATVIVDSKFISRLNSKIYSFVFLSSIEEFTFIAPKNSRVRTLEIWIPRAWLYKKLNIPDVAEMVSLYKNNKDKKNEIDFITPEFIRKFPGTIGLARKQNTDQATFENRVKIMLDEFISNLSSRLHELENDKKIKIVNDEITRLLDVRDCLLKDLSTPPDFSSLRKIAAMSGTTLKTKFKKMYGTTMYEYYQQMRMEKARILLLSFQFSVGDVGHQVGYINLSNFSIAFKKNFGYLPHKFLQLHKEQSLAETKKAN